MPTLDQLPADRRAIIELILRQGRSYAQLSELLDTPTPRVRELAREALSELTPVSGERVEARWRGQVADYVLGQQSGPEAGATRGHLKRSEPARAWALSLADSLSSLYADGARPEVPAPEGAAAKPGLRRPGKRAPAAAPAGPLSPEARRLVLRRRILGGAAGAVVLLALVPLALGQGAFFLIGGGGDGGDRERPAGREQAAEPRILATIPLAAVRGAKGEGVAVVVDTGNEQRLRVVAQGLEPAPPGTQQDPGDAYEVWLYNSCKDSKSLGAGKTDEQGSYQGESAAAIAPADLARYRYIDVSREKIDRNVEHVCKSVLRGRIDQAQAAPQAGGAGQAPPALPGGAQ